MPHSKIRVLIVDDSPVTQLLLFHILGSDAAIDVIGSVRDGQAALRVLKRVKPDVIAMDVNLSKTAEISAIREIMKLMPVPILILSNANKKEDAVSTFKALDAGAVAVLEKPPGMDHSNHQLVAAKLIFTVKSMAGVRVFQRRPRRTLQKLKTDLKPPLVEKPATMDDYRIVALGASTGGPPVLADILSHFPKNFPLPVVIVQHIADGFGKGMAEWLDKLCSLSVTTARDGDKIESGKVFLAPDGAHLKVHYSGHLSICSAPRESGHRPSVDFLFRSVAEVYGSQSIGILLTGMGRDGAVQLKKMRDRGAVTIAQDEKTSVVHGMPGEAIKIEAAQYVMSPADITAFLAELNCFSEKNLN